MTRRRKARELLVQSLYAAEISSSSLEHALTDQIARRNPGKDSIEYIRARAKYQAAHREELDEAIDAVLTGWRPERVSPVERCILRMSLGELREVGSPPAGVVLDEAVELARTFSGDDAARFVNGVLDKLLKQMRDSGS